MIADDMRMKFKTDNSWVERFMQTQNFVNIICWRLKLDLYTRFAASIYGQKKIQDELARIKLKNN